MRQRLATIVERSRWIPQHRGGPGYELRMTLRSGRTERGKILARWDGWDDREFEGTQELEEWAETNGYTITGTVQI